MGLQALFQASLVLSLIDKISSPLGKVQDKVKNLSDAKNVIGGMGLVMSGAGTGALAMGKGFVSAASQVENYKSQLKVMLGSQELANERYKELAEFSNSSSFSTQQAVELGNQLQAMGRYSTDLMNDLGNLASGSGKSIEQVTTAYGKLVSGDKGMAVSMFKNLLITTDDWQAALGKKVENASAKEMLNVLPKIINDVKKFDGMMKEQTKTFSGAFGLMTGLFWDFQATYGEAFLDPLKKGMMFVSGFIEKLLEFAEKHPVLAKGIATVVGAITVLSIVLGLSLFLWSKISLIKSSLIKQVGLLKQSFSQMTVATLKQTGALTAYNVALKASKAGTGSIATANGILFKSFGKQAVAGLGGIPLMLKAIPKSLFTGLLVPLKAVGVALSAIAGVIGAPVGVVVAIIAAVIAVIAYWIYQIKQIRKNWDLMGDSFKKVGKSLLKPFEGLINFLKDIGTKIATFLSPLIQKFLQFFQPVIDFFKKAINGIVVFFSDGFFNIRKALSYFSGFMMGRALFLFSKIGQAISLFLDATIGTLKTTGSAIKKIWDAIWDPEKSIKDAIKESGEMFGEHFNNLGNQFKDLTSFKLSDEATKELDKINEQQKQLEGQRTIAIGVEKAQKQAEKAKKKEVKANKITNNVVIEKKEEITKLNDVTKNPIKNIVDTKDNVVASKKATESVMSGNTNEKKEGLGNRDEGIVNRKENKTTIIQKVEINIKDINSIKDIEDFYKMLEVAVSI